MVSSNWIFEVAKPFHHGIETKFNSIQPEQWPGVIIFFDEVENLENAWNRDKIH